MIETATVPARFGPVTTTCDESVARGPDEATPSEQAPDETPERAREIVFELSDVKVKYSGVTAVEDVNVDIAANEITAFIGPSGCGKTTVLRSLNRMHDITPGAEVIGRVTYHGEDLYGPKIDPAEVRRRIGMVFQKPNPFPTSAVRSVTLSRRRSRRPLSGTRCTASSAGARWRCRVDSSSACASPARSPSRPT